MLALRMPSEVERRRRRKRRAQPKEKWRDSDIAYAETIVLGRAGLPLRARVGRKNETSGSGIEDLLLGGLQVPEEDARIDVRMRGLMRASAWAGLLLALIACSAGDRVHEQTHQTLSVSRTPNVNVRNVAGLVRVEAWQKPLVDVKATKTGYDLSDLRNVTIDVQQEGDTVVIATKYSGDTHGGGVDYQISVPEGASTEIHNVAGAVELTGVRGNVVVETQAGQITANLGKVEGDRSIALSATTGAIRLSIAPDSSASVDATSTIGHFSSSFPAIAQSSENVVGTRASGKIGSGSATIRLSTTVGAIELRH